jgi:hypothetical protein
MGAVSFTSITQNGGVGNRRSVDALVTFSNSYATGGDTVSLPLLGLKALYSVWEAQGMFAAGPIEVASAFTPNTHGLQLVLAGSITAPKLKVIAGTAGTPVEVTAATNLSTLPAVFLEFRGI